MITRLMNQLAAALINKKVRTNGTVEEPLFCVADAAEYIGDANYRRALKSYPKSYAKAMYVPDLQGQKRLMHFFTEKGLYRYLLQSHLPKAEPFQAYVFDLLVAERKRVVEKALLEAKIAQDALRLAEGRVGKLESELKHSKGFQMRGDTTFDDYAEWCLERLNDEHPLLAPDHLADRELGVLSYYFTQSLFEDGYADLAELCSEGIDDPLPRIYRQVGTPAVKC